MAETRNADQLRADLVRQMGPDFGPFWDLLRHQLVLLHAKWRQFRELYGSSSERIDLLNASAPFFFAMLQNILWDDIVLHIARLVDEPGRGDRTMLTIRRIPAFVRGTPIEKSVSKRVKSALAATRFVHERRNRRIAHADLKHLLDQRPEPLKGGSRAEVEAALSAFRELFNEVGGHYSDSHMVFDYDGVGGADCLLRRLAEGKKAYDARMERLLNGTESRTDWRHGPTI